MTVYCFDGTKNHRHIMRPNGRIRHVDGGGGTNVAKLSDILAEESEYLGGIGNAIDFTAWSNPSSLAYSMGCKSLVDQMEERLEERLEAGDHTIDLIGLGRGAIQAVELAHRIADRGDGLPIRFIGLFDPVTIGNHNDNTLRHELPQTIPIARVAEIIAFHEARINMPAQVHDLTSANIASHAQEIAKGSHVDVGGGFSACGLSDCALQWMIDQAQQAGLRFQPAAEWAICGEPLVLRPNPEQLPHRLFDADYPPRPRRLPQALVDRARAHGFSLGDWHRVIARKHGNLRSKVLMNLDPYIEDSAKPPGYRIIDPHVLFPKRPRPGAHLNIDRKLDEAEILALMLGGVD